MAVNPEEAEAPNVEANKLSLTLFRRPEKFKIGEDFDLFIKKSNLYFKAVELEDVKKRRLALLFSLSEDAFRSAEPVEFGEGENREDIIGKEPDSYIRRNVTIFIVENRNLVSLLIRMLFLCERLELNVVSMGMNILAGW